MTWKIVSMIRKYHNHKLQKNPWHREEEPHNNHETPENKHYFDGASIELCLESNAVPVMLMLCEDAKSLKSVQKKSSSALPSLPCWVGYIRFSLYQPQPCWINLYVIVYIQFTASQPTWFQSLAEWKQYGFWSAGFISWSGFTLLF